MEEEARKRMLRNFEEAIDFVNEVQVRFTNRIEDFKSFLQVVRMYPGGRNVVHTAVSSHLKGHPDLLSVFERFLNDTKPVPLSQTAPVKYRDAVRALELRVTGFITKLSRRLEPVIYFQFMEELHKCRIEESDYEETKAMAEEYIGEHSDLMEEFDEIWNRGGRLSDSVCNRKRKREQSSTQDCTRKRSKPDDAPLLSDDERPGEEPVIEETNPTIHSESNPLLNDHERPGEEPMIGEINPPIHSENNLLLNDHERPGEEPVIEETNPTIHSESNPLLNDHERPGEEPMIGDIDPPIHSENNLLLDDHEGPGEEPVIEEIGPPIHSESR